MMDIARSEFVECPRCGAANYDNASRCAECGYVLLISCPRCGLVNRTGKARPITLGNDDSLPISGYNGEGRAYSKRPVLGYGKTWKRSGFTCVSRSTGLTCRRGSHGFFLSRESRRLF